MCTLRPALGSRVPPVPGMSQGPAGGRGLGQRSAVTFGLLRPARCERKVPDLPQGTGTAPGSGPSPPPSAQLCQHRSQDALCQGQRAGNSRRRISHPLSATVPGAGTAMPLLGQLAEPRAGCVPQPCPILPRRWKGPRGEPSAGCTPSSAAGSGSGRAAVLPKGSCTI